MVITQQVWRVAIDNNMRIGMCLCTIVCPALAKQRTSRRDKFLIKLESTVQAICIRYKHLETEETKVFLDNYYKGHHSLTHSMNTLVIDDVLIINILFGGMHRVGPLVVMQYISIVIFFTVSIEGAQNYTKCKFICTYLFHSWCHQSPEHIHTNRSCLFLQTLHQTFVYLARNFRHFHMDLSYTHQ